MVQVRVNQEDRLKDEAGTLRDVGGRRMDWEDTGVIRGERLAERMDKRFGVDERGSRGRGEEDGPGRNQKQMRINDEYEEVGKPESKFPNTASSKFARGCSVNRIKI